MYLPAHFTWTDPDAILAFCRVHAFATIVSEGADGPEAQHLPLLVDRVDDRLVLHGHAALGDPVWRAARALAVFAGPHAYVSAAWYGEADTVPTWNYLAVHVRGRLSVIDDPATARDLFARLAAAVADPEAETWQARLSPAVAAKLGGMIRWFRIDVERIEAKAKLSQNRPPALRERVIDHLAASPDPSARAVAAAMVRLQQGQPPWPADPG